MVAGRQNPRAYSRLHHWLAFLLLAFIGCKMIYEAAIVKHQSTSRKIDFPSCLSSQV
ncbi:manganese efflux pump [Candidatus Bathyarchaeota archaeon]|nr:manganese efflux pump [Candidatus Bathyarchaeota archaeon]MBS7636537.1 manganese efflux pump [Candidatus Bathyarchaeota archaeon]